MKIKVLFFLLFIILFSLFLINPVYSEEKMDVPSGGIIPKLPKTADDPELLNGHVYPFWGPVCQRYTYSVVYRDKEGRAPEYVKMYFNGQMIDLEKANPNNNDYKKGVRYEYKFVPNKLGSNFYYFEASNGLGKARESIIDSPDNGPVLFESGFTKNEIAVIDSKTGEKILQFPTNEEWIGGIALSDDGKYLAAKASKHIYFFDTTKPNEPLWEFKCEQCMIGGDVKGGIDISGDGSKIIAAYGNRVSLFDKSSNKPLWTYDKAGNSYNVAISHDSQYAGAATAGEEADLNSNLIIVWQTNNAQPLWQYHASGNFHDISFSDDGSFIAGSTGCPDRRFYLFSKDSNEPLIRTEMLTRDSPVHRAKISRDGSFIAVGSESDGGAVFLFSKDSNAPVWKFPMPEGSSVRALNFTPDGQYIGAATFGGQAYIFSKDKNTPIKTWSIKAALGGIDIADDGSFIATGGTDNKVHILSRDQEETKEIAFDEYVEEVDISANGKYIAVGTGGSVYFFESFNEEKENKVFPCSTIIEPKPESELMSGFDLQEAEAGEQVKSSLCGNNKCESPETIDNCKVDCDPNYKKSFLSQASTMVIGSGLAFFASFIFLAFFTALRKFAFLNKLKVALAKLNQLPPFSFLRLNAKKVTIIFSALTVIFLIMTIVAVFLNRPLDNDLGKKDKSGTTGQTQQTMPAEERVCGNNLCEPDFGESKTSCPQDCSEGD